MTIDHKTPKQSNCQLSIVHCQLTSYFLKLGGILDDGGAA
jgi:hypothetical protein